MNTHVLNRQALLMVFGSMVGFALCTGCEQRRYDRIEYTEYDRVPYSQHHFETAPTYSNPDKPTSTVPPGSTVQPWQMVRPGRMIPPREMIPPIETNQPDKPKPPPSKPQ